MVPTKKGDIAGQGYLSMEDRRETLITIPGPLPSQQETIRSTFRHIYYRLRHEKAIVINGEHTYSILKGDFFIVRRFQGFLL